MEQRVSRGKKCDQQIPAGEIQYGRQANACLGTQTGHRSCKQWHRKKDWKMKTRGLLHVCIGSCYTPLTILRGDANKDNSCKSGTKAGSREAGGRK